MNATGGIGDTQHIEIALQDTVFAGCAVNHDIGIFQTDFFSVQVKGKISLVDGGNSLVIFQYRPDSIPDGDHPWGEFLTVNGTENIGSTSYGDHIFG